MPGDTVKVHAGTYREWVSPANGGTAEHRIVYESAGDGEVVITGAEPVSDWTDVGGRRVARGSAEYAFHRP